MGLMWQDVAVNAFMLGLALGGMKVMLNSAVSNIKEHCQFQQQDCSRRMGNLEGGDKELRDRLNSHGHKGLDQNGAKVTV